MCSIRLNVNIAHCIDTHGALSVLMFDTGLRVTCVWREQSVRLMWGFCAIILRRYSVMSAPGGVEHIKDVSVNYSKPLFTVNGQHCCYGSLHYLLVHDVWWLVRVTLVVAFGFCPKILGGGEGLWLVILLKKECNFSSADNVRWWGYSNTARWLKKLNFWHSQAVGMLELSDIP